ncbi:MAG: hypothetical protein H7124_00040 [Phycisphaerales bacterium]|nr:hypothetical protein [Hyphomonadaceae bacterium]
MRSFVFAAALIFAGAAQAETPQDLLASLAGQWEGALGYRDYQSNELFELAVVTSIRTAEDGRTLVRTSRFDEGDAPDVFIVSVSGFDDSSGLYETAGFRAGRAMAVTRESIVAQTVQGPEHWTLLFSERGMDDDREADIRVTLTRTGDETLSVKEVDYLDDPAVRFEFRNQTRLRRVQ